MRIHRLALRAFGPYADSQVIDFDALSAHGLHLIHGATGAGKSSILDAICFALYGHVPGARAGNRETLVSDHAEPGARPTVTLEFTVAGRRLRIERSPEHTAPKKRGTGTTRRPASVLLEELRDGTWRGVATRLDEAGVVLHDLIGMHLDQFAQVVLLPQGEFAAFLRAKPDERSEVLQRLFDISRFSDVETYLVDRRKQLRAAADRAREQVRTHLARAEDAVCEVDTDLGVLEWSGEEITALPDLVSRAQTTMSDRVGVAMAEADVAGAEAEQHQRTLTQAESTARLQAAAADARSCVERFAAEAVDRELRIDRLRASRRAQLIHPYHANVLRRQDALDEAAASAQSAVGAARRVGLPQCGDGDALDRLRVRLEEGWSRLQESRPLVERRDVLGQRVRAAETAYAQACRKAESGAGRLERLTAERDELVVRLEECARSEADLADATHELRALDAALAAAGELMRWLPERSRARERVRTEGARFASCEEDVLRLRRRHLDGVAARLALDLRDGQPCAVCGSTDHPAPAASHREAVGEDRIDAAEQDAAEAGTALREAEQVAATAQARVEAANARVAESIDALPATLDVGGRELGDHPQEPRPDRVRSLVGSLREHRGAANSRVEKATAAGQARADLQSRADEVASTVTTLGEELTVAHETASVAQSALETAHTDLDQCEKALTATLHKHEEACPCVFGGAPEGLDLDGLEARHRRAQRRLADVLESHQVLLAAQHEFDAARARLAAAVEEHGFESADDAESARLPEPDQERLQAELEAEQEACARAEGVLAMPEVEQAMVQTPPDLEALGAACARAKRVARAAQGRQSATERAYRSLQALEARIDRVIDESHAVFDELATIEPLADIVSGSGDNRLRMRLTSYVLAARLESVTALANEKLRVMTSGRFSLEHTDALARRGAKSGLGLRVRDSWTGAVRDTATLSGGESFMASLALALGLGDAVLKDSGGRPLQTLFVDEGFGSLDEESLEQVMEVLDGLRAGGRSVGIVSHVRELRDRIPAQVRVRKTSRGSTIDVVTPGSAAA